MTHDYGVEIPNDRAHQIVEASLERADWSNVPEHLRDGLRRFIGYGCPVGDFLSAVLDNDLRGACSKADHINRYRLFDVVHFLYNHAPDGCWGNPARRLQWQESDGLLGVARAQLEGESDE